MTGVGVGLFVGAVFAAIYFPHSIRKEAKTRRKNGGRDPGARLSRVGQTSFRYQWIDFVGIFNPHRAAMMRHAENYRVDQMWCPCGRRPTGSLRGDEYRCDEHVGLLADEIEWALGYHDEFRNGEVIRGVRNHRSIYDGFH